MGLSAYREVLSKGKVSQDPVLNTQVTRVGRRIADATGKNYQWEFKVLEDKQANAFCLPGGKVAVYTGILPITQDDAGLAAVLGHEVAHAIARHGGERVSQTLLVQSTLAATQVALSRNDPPDRGLDPRSPPVLPTPLAGAQPAACRVGGHPYT